MASRKPSPLNDRAVRVMVREMQLRERVNALIDRQVMTIDDAHPVMIDSVRRQNANRPSEPQYRAVSTAMLATA